MSRNSEIETCHYCGKEFTAESMLLSRHLYEATEVLAELPTVLGQGMGIGSIDIHEGRLYSVTVRPGPCMDDVKVKLVSREHAQSMILTEIGYHEQMAKRLNEGREKAFSKIAALPL